MDSLNILTCSGIIKACLISKTDIFRLVVFGSLSKPIKLPYITFLGSTICAFSVQRASARTGALVGSSLCFDTQPLLRAS